MRQQWRTQVRRYKFDGNVAGNGGDAAFHPHRVKFVRQKMGSVDGYCGGADGGWAECFVLEQRSIYLRFFR